MKGVKGKGYGGDGLKIRGGGGREKGGVGLMHDQNRGKVLYIGILHPVHVLSARGRQGRGDEEDDRIDYRRGLLKNVLFALLS
jgi:hypothetical protein